MAKARDYKRESNLRKEATAQFAFRIEKQAGEDLKKCLQEYNIPISKWFYDMVRQTLTAWDEKSQLDVSKFLNEPEDVRPDVNKSLDEPENIRIDVRLCTVDEALKLRAELGLTPSSRRTFERAVKNGKLVSVKKQGKKNLYEYDCIIAWDGKG